VAGYNNAKWNSFSDMSTTTLAANISTIGGAIQGYFGVLIDSFLPLVIGIGVTVGVWLLVKSGVFRLFSR